MNHTSKCELAVTTCDGKLFWPYDNYLQIVDKFYQFCICLIVFPYTKISIIYNKWPSWKLS